MKLVNRHELLARTLVRVLTSAEHNPQLAAQVGNGAVVEDPRGRAYVLSNVQHGGTSATLRRVIPKVRGKQARRADKRARRGKGLL